MNEVKFNCFFIVCRLYQLPEFWSPNTSSPSTFNVSRNKFPAHCQFQTYWGEIGLRPLYIRPARKESDKKKGNSPPKDTQVAVRPSPALKGMTSDLPDDQTFLFQCFCFVFEIQHISSSPSPTDALYFAIWPGRGEGVLENHNILASQK